jgi:hypothetical protein
MIKKKGSGYEYRTKDGEKLLGKHKSKAAAMRQAAAVAISKKRKGKR